MPGGRPRARTRGAVITLTGPEKETLRNLADYHLRAMGPMRHLVRLTSRREVRQRLGYLTQESMYLRLFMEGELQKEAGEGPVMFTIPALVAFWGRVLSSLNTRRSRRKLKPSEVERREELSRRFAAVARQLSPHERASFDQELDTRRPREIQWITLELATKRDDG